jgi:ribosomal protein S18 acetylase RimI-like enzyme
VNIRTATEADLATIRELYEEFLGSMEGEPEYLRETWEDNRERAERRLRSGDFLIAEDDGGAVAFAETELHGPSLGWIEALYVRERARRSGVSRALIAEATRRFRERGATHIGLEVLDGNAPARALYDRLGFEQIWRGLSVDAATLESRLAERPRGASFGSVHVQTDDRAAVERAVHHFLPRLGQAGGTIVSAPRTGWVAVYNELCDRDPAALRRLAKELADRMGAVVLLLGVEEDAVVRFVLYERGTVMDEYLSVQEYYGPLPPGDVIALAANPRVVARLTGADPEAVRTAAVHAKRPEDLPPARELVASIARAIGIEGGDHGYEGAA